MPKAWKRYVDDTFTTLDRGTVDDFYGISQPEALHPLHHRDIE